MFQIVLSCIICIIYMYIYIYDIYYCIYIYIYVYIYIYIYVHLWGFMGFMGRVDTGTNDQILSREGELCKCIFH